MVTRAMGFLLSILTASALAATVSKTLIYTINDSELGTLRIELAEKREPVIMPFNLKVKLECIDHRADKKSKANFPAKAELTRQFGESICKYEGYRFDQATKVLTVEYMISTTPEGIGECDTKVSQPYNLTELCAEYSR